MKAKDEVLVLHKAGEIYTDLSLFCLPNSCHYFPSVELSQKPSGKRAWGDAGHSIEKWRMDLLEVAGEELADGE